MCCSKKLSKRILKRLAKIRGIPKSTKGMFIQDLLELQNCTLTFSFCANKYYLIIIEHNNNIDYFSVSKKLFRELFNSFRSVQEESC